MKIPPINKRTIYLASGVILMIILIVWAYNFVMRHRPVKLPHETDWGRSLNQSESSTIARFTTELYADMDGVNLTGHDNNLYKEVATLPERVLLGVGNYFREKYRESLIEWIQAESFWGAADEYSKIIVARLSAMGVQ